MKFLSLTSLIATIFIIMFANMVYANHLDFNPAEKLITQHLQASGGINALMNIQSISRYGHITFHEQKDNLCYHTDIIYPIKLREQIKGKEIAYDRGTDGNSFWLWTGSQYEVTKDKKLIDYMQRTAERANREMLWVKKKANNFAIITAPSWSPSHSHCIQEIKAKDANKRIYCFDATGLLNALSKGKEYRLESDWRQVGNIRLPFHITHYQNGVIVFDLQLDHAELNKMIPTTRFVKPDLPQLSC